MKTNELSDGRKTVNLMVDVAIAACLIVVCFVLAMFGGICAGVVANTLGMSLESSAQLAWFVCGVLTVLNAIPVLGKFIDRRK